ncbi:MAG: ABC transporter ATP-binding protein [Desulfobacterales bacterium]|jgi:iron(III) transport system ATP-binding protein
MRTTVLKVENVRKTYGKSVVLNGLSFGLEEGAIGCLLGPSGCGKTTALRAVAGFEPIQGGRIRIGSDIVSSPGTHVPPERRRIGMVFQDYALFPHLTVRQNVAFGLRNKNATRPRVDELLEMVGLEGIADQFPHELSGGQQQRTALARALAPNPRLLLMDEPFSNLDVTLRERLSIDVRDVLRRRGTTAVLVTHNQHEAFAMADHIGIMDAGGILQWDTAYQLYHRPQSPAVASFVGEGVLIDGQVVSDGRVRTGLGLLEGRFTYPCSNGCPAKVLIRPEDVAHDDDSPHQAEILQKHFRGPSILYMLKLSSGERVLSIVPSHHDHRIGDSIGIRTRVEEIVLFEANALETSASRLLRHREPLR